MAYRNKTYACFDGDTDMHYYRLMTAWRDNEHHDFNFHDAHEINSARDSSQEESIKRQLRERFANSKQLIVLIGEKTRLLRKFVEWELQVAVRLKLPIIAVNLNGNRKQDDRCPPAIRDELAIFVPFNQKIITYAMENWAAADADHRANGVKEARFYKDFVYSDLGIAA